MKKDMSICLEQAQNYNFPLPLTALSLQQFLGGSACSVSLPHNKSVCSRA